MLHLIKLCVGAESVEDLQAWQDNHRWPDGQPRHLTRMWPKREAELLDGGSLYWVFKGTILARQEIRALEEIEGVDGIRRCALVLSPDIIRTEGAARRPFQGWRYLPAEDAPRDLPAARHHDDVLPEEMARALAELGLR